MQFLFLQNEHMELHDYYYQMHPSCFRVHFLPDTLTLWIKHLEYEVVGNYHSQKTNTIAHGCVYCGFQEMFVFLSHHC
jgi:hypothetical protein